jgi:hypothetical protein
MPKSRLKRKHVTEEEIAIHLLCVIAVSLSGIAPSAVQDLHSVFRLRFEV